MQTPTVIRIGPDLFTRIAVDSGDLRRVLSTRQNAKRDDASYNIELYAVVGGSELMGVLSLVEFPDAPGVCVIDFLSIADNAPAGTRELLLGKALECQTVIASTTSVPTLIAHEEFELRGDTFVHSTNPITDEELITLCQMYQARVSCLFPLS